MIALALVVLAVAVAAPAAWALDQYVGLGDSYSAGVGTRDVSVDRNCERSPLAYPVLVASERPGTSLSFVACGGAVTQDVLADQVAWLSPSTTLATISIGGNDAGFGRLVRSCALSTRSCLRIIGPAEAFVREELPDRLDAVYAEIRRRAPAARVLVVGYPPLFAERRPCNAVARIDVVEQRALNDAARLLNATTRSRALAAGFEFVDAERSFAHHKICDDEEWVNGPAIPISASYHPNPRGYRAYADLVHAAIGAAPLARVNVLTTCFDAEHVPVRITVTCADGNRRLASLRWTLWSTERAEGRGTAVVNTCWPSCVEGEFRRYPVTVVLSAPRDCPQESPPRQFTRLRYRYTRGRPYNHWRHRREPRTQTHRLACGN